MTRQTIHNSDILQAEEQIRACQNDISYDIRDFTVDYIVKCFREDLFFKPEYQREYVWNDKMKARFIESLLLGLPIPFMFLAECDDGKLEIVDGVQRISTMESFLNNDIALKKLEILTSVNGFRYKDLPLAQRRKLSFRPMRMIVLDQRSTQTNRSEIFNRINTGGLKAKPSEIRRGILVGGFIDFIKECASNPLFRRLCPISPRMLAHREDEELVTRFFAYSENYTSFRHDVDRFLASFVSEHRTVFERERYLLEFNNVLSFVERGFPAGFAKTLNDSNTPRVRFEAIAVGVNLALREKPNLEPSPIEWLDSEAFKNHTTTHASNSLPRLRGRIEYVKNILLSFEQPVL